MIYNIYCDESCHLEHSEPKGMVLGAVYCLTEYSREIADAIREIKSNHGINARCETKWTGVSPSRIAFYTALLDYFMSNDNLYFRALIVPDKKVLDHSRFGQDHSIWYYKMLYDLLKVIFKADSTYRIFLDIKDTHSGEKAYELREVLTHRIRELENCSLELVQNVRSHEVQQIQLTDLLIGAVSYANRGLKTSRAKLELVQYFQRISGKSIIDTTSANEVKVNILRWDPARGRHD